LAVDRRICTIAQINASCRVEEIDPMAAGEVARLFTEPTHLVAGADLIGAMVFAAPTDTFGAPLCAH
jgi:hypothetical protein